MLVLTLLCRDEADILESMLRFHLAQGVDRIIATDNGSVDGSLQILQRFERRGQLTLLQETEQTHDQAVWVTRMARMAAAAASSTSPSRPAKVSRPNAPTALTSTRVILDDFSASLAAIST